MYQARVPVSEDVLSASGHPAAISAVHKYTPFQTANLVEKAWQAQISHGMTDTRELCREAIIDALSPLNSLGDSVAASEGAIYLWAKLPECQWHMSTHAHHQHHHETQCRTLLFCQLCIKLCLLP